MQVNCLILASFRNELDNNVHYRYTGLFKNTITATRVTPKHLG